MTEDRIGVSFASSLWGLLSDGPTARLCHTPAISGDFEDPVGQSG